MPRRRKAGNFGSSTSYHMLFLLQRRLARLKKVSLKPCPPSCTDYLQNFQVLSNMHYPYLMKMEMNIFHVQHYVGDIGKKAVVDLRAGEMVYVAPRKSCTAGTGGTKPTALHLATLLGSDQVVKMILPPNSICEPRRSRRKDTTTSSCGMVLPRPDIQRASRAWCGSNC